MSALSISPALASGSSAQAPVSQDAAGEVADNSPFAMLLAAITAADPTLQTATDPASTQTQAAAGPVPQAANDDDSDASDITDTANDPAANIPQLPTVSESTPPKSAGKPEKKAAADNIVATVDPSLIQAQMLATQPVPVPPQAAVQTQSLADDGDAQDISAIGEIAGNAAPATPLALGSNAVPAQPAVAANGPAKTAAPAVPATPANPASAAAPPTPAASQDRDTDDTDVTPPDSAAAFGQTMAATHMHGAARSNPLRTTEEKPVTSGPTATATQPASPPMDDETDAASPESQTPVANAAPSADGPPQPDPTIGAPPAPPKADGKPANKPAQTFQIGATSQGNAPAKAPSAAADAPAATDSLDNSKPVHTLPPQAQPEVPQASPHAIANAAPESAVAINLGASNTQSGLTLPVHVTGRDTDSQTNAPAVTPNTDALAVSIAARSVSGAKQFDIRLDPPELGRVEVRLSIDASGKTQAHLTADQPQTVALLQKDAPNLTRALRDAGLDVSQNGLNFSLKGQGQNQGGQSGNFGTPSRSLALPAVAQSIDAASSSPSLPSSLLGSARLDIHV